MGKLLSYFQADKIDSEGQLKAAQAVGKKYTASQNAQAKSAGFPSADAMTVYGGMALGLSSGSLTNQNEMLFP